MDSEERNEMQTFTTESGKTVTLRKYGFQTHGQTLTIDENKEVWAAWLTLHTVEKRR